MLNTIKAFSIEFSLLLLLGVAYCLLVSSFEINVYNELPLFDAVRRSVTQGPDLFHPSASLASPLAVWLMNLSASLFGLSVWSVRLPGLLTTLAAIVLTYVYVLITIKSRSTALFSSLVLGACLGFFELSELSGQGSLLTCALVGVFLAYHVWRGQLGKRKPMPQEVNKASCGLGLAVGLLLLTQGTLGLLLAALIIGLHLLTQPPGRMQGQFNARVFWIAFGGLFILSVSVMALQPEGGILLQQWLGLPALQLASTHLSANLSQVLTLIAGLIPFLFFLGAFLWELTQQRRSTGPSHLGQEHLQFLGGWLLVNLLLMLVFSPEHNTSLLIPCFVPLACLTGSYMARFFDGEEPTPAYQWATELSILFLGAGAVALSVFLFYSLSETHPVEFWHFPGPVVIDKVHLLKKDFPLDPPFPVWKLWLTPGPFILLIVALVLYILHTLRRSRQTGVALVVGWIVFLFFMKALFIPVLQRPITRQLAHDLIHLVRPTDTLWIDGTQQELAGIVFYLRPKPNQRIIVSSEQPEESTETLTQWIANPSAPPILGLIREETYYQLNDDTRSQISVINHRWKWRHFTPGNVLQLFNGNYMQRLTYNILLFRTLPPDPDFNADISNFTDEMLEQTNGKKRKKRRR